MAESSGWTLRQQDYMVALHPQILYGRLIGCGVAKRMHVYYFPYVSRAGYAFWRSLQKYMDHLNIHS